MEMLDDLFMGGFVLFLAVLMGTFMGTAWLDARQYAKPADAGNRSTYLILMTFLALISCVLAYFAIDTIREGTLCSAWWFLASPLPCLVGFTMLTPFLLRK